jgi:hypothetical protein
MSEENPIIEFFETGKSLWSKDGLELLNNSDVAVIKEAAKDNPLLIQNLCGVHNMTRDPYFRRKISQALFE